MRAGRNTSHARRFARPACARCDIRGVPRVLSGRIERLRRNEIGLRPTIYSLCECDITSCIASLTLVTIYAACPACYAVGLICVAAILRSPNGPEPTLRSPVVAGPVASLARFDAFQNAMQDSCKASPREQCISMRLAKKRLPGHGPNVRQTTRPVYETPHTDIPVQLFYPSHWRLRAPVLLR